MSDQRKREFRDYINDILEATHNIHEFTQTEVRKTFRELSVKHRYKKTSSVVLNRKIYLLWER